MCSVLQNFNLFFCFKFQLDWSIFRRRNIIFCFFVSVNKEIQSFYKSCNKILSKRDTVQCTKLKIVFYSTFYHYKIIKVMNQNCTIILTFGRKFDQFLRLVVQLGYSATTATTLLKDKKPTYNVVCPKKKKIVDFEDFSHLYLATLHA